MQGRANQALEQTRDSVLWHGERIGCELLNFFVRQEITMDRQDVIAAVALKALDREMRLRGIIDQPAVEYYFQSGPFGFAKSVAMLCVLAWCLYDMRIPFWGAVSLVVAWIALEESRRQASRFNALVQLMEIQNQQAPHADSETFSDRKLADG